MSEQDETFIPARSTLERRAAIHEELVGLRKLVAKRKHVGVLPNPRIEPTLTTAQAARIFGCSARTLYELARKGEAPVEPLRLGRRLRWPTVRVLAAIGIEDE